ncbi:MAG: thioesterase family protein [Sporolactobacillus sp.]
MHKVMTRFRARYNETDQMGVVHHSQYVNWCEVARTDWIKQFGLTYRQVEEDGLMIPVIGVELHYHRPARYDDPILIESSLKAYDGVKMIFQYRILNEVSKEQLAEATTAHCWTDKNMRPVALRKKRPAMHHLLLEAIDTAL